MKSIIIVFVASSLLFFGYQYFFNPYKLQLLYQSWDGPAYVVVAQSFYNPELTEKVNTVGLPNYYFANYFPLYPIFIKIFSFIGYFRSSIFVSQLFAFLFILVMYKLFKLVYPKEKLNWIIIPFIFFPARWFSITHIGSSEPLFLFLVSLHLFFLLRRQHVYSAIFLALAQFTRHAAIWFFLGISIYYFLELLRRKVAFNKFIRIYTPYLIVPLTLIIVNFIFYQRSQDFSFWQANSQKASYFQLIPYHIFSLPAGGVWKESLIFNYLLYIGGILLFFKAKKFQLGIIACAIYIPLVFFVQEDLSRIALSGLPLIYLAYHRIITNKVFRIALILLTPAIYLFSFHFLNYNISP